MLSLLVALVLQSEGAVDFKRDVRPILSENCFLCHGPDEKNRKAKLRLDVKAGAFAEIDGHAPFVPGRPEKSEAWRRVTTNDPDDRMPPSKSGKKLTPKQIDMLRRWIEQGARWSEHWAFEAPRKTEPPTKSRNAVDAFILARLEREGLAPASEADRVTLLRRLSLDLVGLPPEPAEIDAFLKGREPGAYEREVERLLASPHYGERWGRLWLDAARYADSDGYEKDKTREVWFYRDWVIGAFNKDVPYDRFVIEQIAGDLLPGATQDQVVATGFLRNSMINEEGGVDPEQFRMEAMFDRMDAIGKGVLGLTIQCAQCHSHKYDPLTQEEYYRMFAFLNDAHEASAVVYTPEEAMRRSGVLGAIREIEADLRHRVPDRRERMARWEEGAREGQPAWIVVRPEVDDISTGGQKYLPQEDGSLLAQSYAPTKHRVKLTVKRELADITGLRIELLKHPDLPCGGPGRSTRGTAALTEVEVEAAPAGGKSSKVKIVRATSDVELPEAPLGAQFSDKTSKKRVTGPAAFAIDGKEETAWGTDSGPGRRNQPRKAVFAFEKPVNAAEITVYLKQNHGGWNSDDHQNCNLGRFRLSLTSAPDPVVDPLPAAVREIFSIPAAGRSPAQEAALFSAWRTTVAEWAESNAKIEELWKSHPEGTAQMVLQSREKPRATRLLERGDFLKPKGEVAAGVPAFLHPLRGDGTPTRLSFARWLVDRGSPTAARAIVNRVWQAYFGTGLMATSEDLGSQGEAPSHPELLDWLAVEFMERGWSLKSLHRQIVTSATYRQESRVTPELLSRDPYNRLLARGSRFRVDGEIVRDIALTASGLLNRKVGGRSVRPPAPAALFSPPVSYGPKPWVEDLDSERHRRAIYTFRYRSVPYPMLQAFDTPNGDFSCVRRTRSNTPLQALTALNEPIFMECARALGARAAGREGAVEDRVAHAFRLCTGRLPEASELTLLLEFLRKQTEALTGRPEAVKGLAGEKDAGPERGAWTALARVLLNLDETITRE